MNSTDAITKNDRRPLRVAYSNADGLLLNPLASGPDVQGPDAMKHTYGYITVKVCVFPAKSVAVKVSDPEAAVLTVNLLVSVGVWSAAMNRNVPHVIMPEPAV